MKILLTGILPSSVWTIAMRLSRGEHQVTVLGQIGAPKKLPEGVKLYNMHPGHADALKLMEAVGYECVVFFFACQCEDMRAYGSVQGAMLDALFAMLHQSERSMVSRFALVTDRRVFGINQEGSENETPIPDTPTGVIIKAAEDCLTCGTPERVSRLLIRVTSLYDVGDPDSFFALAAECEKNGVPLVLNGDASTPCDFLHADDLAAFLDLELGENASFTVHLHYGKPYTYGDVKRLLAPYYPKLEITFTNVPERCSTLKGEAARSIHWVPRHDFARELDMLRAPAVRTVATQGGKDSRARRVMRKLAPWLELLALAALAIHLDFVSRDNAIFGSVDYMLLFVAIMGNVHGRRLGEAAALIACAGYGIRWMLEGNDLYLLLYNPDHWLPLCCYLLCGALFGYLSDKTRERIAVLKREKNDLTEQNQFLETVYHQAYEDRNQLQEQVMRFRDSYGRIYQITRELDSFQPEQVFLSTLDVLEDTMQNHSVAIYECKPDASFARLVVRSRDMKWLPRSLELTSLDKMMARMNEAKTFANTSLLPDYPAYAAPIMNDGALRAILMLWDVPFEKQSQYYVNLFSVVAGLVQSAMVRALRYFAMSDDVYLENTHILAAQAFRSALGVYQNMRKTRKGQFLLVRVTSEQPLSVEEYDKRIGRAVRSTDLIGRLEDGAFYALFPQATAENLPQISARFHAQSLACEVVAQEVAYG